MRADRSVAVDSLKGIAIIAVLALHALDTSMIERTWAWFHYAQAVTVFAVLMGYNGLRTRTSPLLAYYARRARRLLPPYGVVWVGSLLIGLIAGGLLWGGPTLMGAPPQAGVPGAYFVALLFQFTLILPALRWAWERSPVATLVGAALIDVGFEVAAKAAGVDGFFYASCVARHLFAIALGMWLADGRRVWPFLLLGLPYLAAFTAGYRVSAFNSAWQAQSLSAAGYVVCLVAVALRLLERAPRVLAEIGRASYHIFLVQMLWFGNVSGALYGRSGSVTLALASIAGCCAAGWLLMLGQDALSEAAKRRLVTDPA